LKEGGPKLKPMRSAALLREWVGRTKGTAEKKGDLLFCGEFYEEEENTKKCWVKRGKHAKGENHLREGGGLVWRAKKL